MKVDDFERAEQPAVDRSRLKKHAADIFRLKSKGYSLRQIVKFLKSNNCSISVEGLRKYVKRHAAEHATKPGEAPEVSNSEGKSPEAVPAKGSKSPVKKPGEPEKLNWNADKKIDTGNLI